MNVGVGMDDFRFYQHVKEVINPGGDVRVTAHKRKGKNVGIHRQPGRLMRSTRWKPLERQAGHQWLAPVSVRGS